MTQPVKMLSVSLSHTHTFYLSGSLSECVSLCQPLFSYGYPTTQLGNRTKPYGYLAKNLGSRTVRLRNHFLIIRVREGGDYRLRVREGGDYRLRVRERRDSRLRGREDDDYH
jgi:hypothetical protein